MKRRIATALCLILVAACVAQAQEDSKSPQAVREVQDGLRELGFLRGQSTGSWDDRTTDAVQLFLEHAGIDYRAGTNGDTLFILRNALSSEIARRSPKATNLFVPVDGDLHRLRSFVSADGTVALTSVQEALLLWDVKGRRQISAIKRTCCISATTMSDDGSLVAFQTSTGIRIWNVAENRFVAGFEKPKGPPNDQSRDAKIMRFMPTNDSLLIGDQKSRLTLHDFEGGPPRIIAEHIPPNRDTSSIYGYMVGLDVSRDGRYAATLAAFDGELKIWDIGARRLVRSLKLYRPRPNLETKGDLEHDEPVLVAFDRAGKSITVAAPETNVIHRINPANGAVTKIALEHNIASAALSPLRDTFAVSSGDALVVYDLDNASAIRRSETSNEIGAITDSGKTAIILAKKDKWDDGELSVADLVAGTVAPFARAEQRNIEDFAIDVKSGRIQIGVHDNQVLSIALASGEVEGLRVKDSAAADDEEVRMEHLYVAPNGLLVDPIAARIDKAPKTGDRDPWDKDKPILTIDPKTGVVARRFVQPMAALGKGFEQVGMDATADGSRTATTFQREKNPIYDAFISLVDIATGRETRRINLTPFSNDPIGFSNFCRPGNCKRALSSSDPLDGMLGRHAPVALSATGNLVFAGFWEPTVAAYDVNSGRRVATFNTSLDFRRFAPRQRVGPNVNPNEGWKPDVAARSARANSIPRVIAPVPGTDEFVAVLGASLFYVGSESFMLHFRPGSAQPTRVVNIPASTYLAAVSPDGARVALGYDGGLILLVNAYNGDVVAELHGSAGDPTSVRFSSDGRRIVTRATDGVVRIWDTDSGRPVTTTYLFEGGEWLTITPEGFFAASPKGANALLLQRGMREVVAVDQIYQSLYRPDLVREKLAGDPKGLVREAAARLDLTKVMASGAAPQVLIVSPASGSASSTDDIAVEAEVTDFGGGIGRIEWRVNGITLGVEERGLGRAETPASPARGPVKLKRTLALEPGENTVELVAYNAANLIASPPARVIVKWDGAASTVPPKLYVLAVGVNDYWDSRLRLNYAVPDVRALADAMLKAGTGLYQSVEVTTLLDAEVTADNLDKAFSEMGKKVHPRDVFVFFLAGHGKTVDGKYYFLPRNFRYEGEESIVQRGVDQDRFQAWFAQIAARKSILLYDTCESGSLTGDRVQQRGIERVAALEKMTRAMGRTVLSASTDDAPALEGYRGHGVFTYALLEGLGAADTNGNGTIEVTELAAYIDQKVPDLSYEAFRYRQVPQMKIVGSNFPLSSKSIVLTASASASVAAPAIPAKPTHVVIAPAEVRQAAEAGAVRVIELNPGTQVTLVETKDGWAFVARDGRRLGYVEEKALLALH